MPTAIKLWIAYDNEGNSFASTEDAETAAQEFTGNYTVTEAGMRVMLVELELPEIKTFKASIPDAEGGPVTVTAS